MSTDASRASITPDPYPWAIDECFDLYLALVKTNGAVLGLQTTEPIDLILTGDSACVLLTQVFPCDPQC